MLRLCSAQATLVDGISNAEVVVAFGADLVLLNMFDGMLAQPRPGC